MAEIIYEVALLDADGSLRGEPITLDHEPQDREVYRGTRHIWNHTTPAAVAAYYDAERVAFIEFPF